MESNGEGEDLIPIKLLARMMGISYSGFAQAVREGRVAATRRGGFWYASLDDIISAAARGTIQLPLRLQENLKEDDDDDDEHD